MNIEISGYINTSIQEISVHMLSIVVTIMVIQWQNHHGSSQNGAFTDAVDPVQNAIASEL